MRFHQYGKLKQWRHFHTKWPALIMNLLCSARQFWSNLLRCSASLISLVSRSLCEISLRQVPLAKVRLIRSFWLRWPTKHLEKVDLGMFNSKCPPRNLRSTYSTHQIKKKKLAIAKKLAMLFPQKIWSTSQNDGVWRDTILHFKGEHHEGPLE